MADMGWIEMAERRGSLRTFYVLDPIDVEAKFPLKKRDPQPVFPGMEDEPFREPADEDPATIPIGQKKGASATPSALAGEESDGLSLRAIARELDQRGIRTRIGSFHEFEPRSVRIVCWNASQVRRVLLRAAKHADMQQPTGTGHATSEILTNLDVSAEIQARQSPTPAPPALPTLPRTADEPAQADIALWHNWERYHTMDEIKAMLTQGSVTSTMLYCRQGTSCWRPLHELFNEVADVR